LRLSWEASHRLSWMLSLRLPWETAHRLSRVLPLGLPWMSAWELPRRWIATSWGPLSPHTILVNYVAIRKADCPTERGKKTLRGWPVMTWKVSGSLETHYHTSRSCREWWNMSAWRLNNTWRARDVCQDMSQMVYLLYTFECWSVKADSGGIVVVKSIVCVEYMRKRFLDPEEKVSHL
jgi:hypothetical protein